TALAERMRSEAVRTYATTAEALREEASGADLLLNRLRAITQGEGPVGKVLLAAFGLGHPSAIAQRAEAEGKLQALATAVEDESRRLGTLSTTALQEEVRLLAQPPDRLQRAFGAARESVLGEAFPRFFGALDGKPPP